MCGLTCSLTVAPIQLELEGGTPGGSRRTWARARVRAGARVRARARVRATARYWATLSVMCP